MDTAGWRRAIEEDRLASVAVGLLVFAGLLAITVYATGYDVALAFGINTGLLAGAGLLLAGGLLSVDLAREYVLPRFEDRAG